MNIIWAVLETEEAAGSAPRLPHSKCVRGPVTLTVFFPAYSCDTLESSGLGSALPQK